MLWVWDIRVVGLLLYIHPLQPSLGLLHVESVLLDRW